MHKSTFVCAVFVVGVVLIMMCYADVDRGFPKPIAAEFPGVWEAGIDAAYLNTHTNKVYFFRGNQFVRGTPGRGVDRGYPKTIGQDEDFPNEWRDGIDAAMFDHTRNRVYFFKGNKCIRYTLQSPERHPILTGQIPSGSGSMTRTVSGYIETNEGRSEYVHIYAFQYVSISSNRSLLSHNGSRSFGGILGDEDEYTLRGIAGNWVIYQGPRFAVAIPWDDEHGIYVAEGLVGPRGAGWQLITR